MTRGGGLKHLWEKIVDKFSLKNHTHIKSEITDFPTSYSISQIDGLQSVLDKKTFVSIRNTPAYYVTGTEDNPTGIFLPTLDVGELCLLTIDLNNGSRSKTSYYTLYTPNIGESFWLYQGLGAVHDNYLVSSGEIAAGSYYLTDVFFGRLK